MRVSCAVCGKGFEAKRSTAKYCGNRCKNQAWRGVRPGDADETPERGEQHPRTLLETVKSDLQDAGVLESASGQQALAVAGRMMQASADTGSAFAALSRELSRVVAEAKAKPGARVNPVDEFTARRQAKRGAA